jgi:Gene product 88
MKQVNEELAAGTSKPFDISDDLIIPKYKGKELYKSLARLSGTGDKPVTLISEGNAKTGPSFSLQFIVTCHYRTMICERICYGSYGNMNYSQNRNIRDERTLWVYRNLRNGHFKQYMIDELTRLYNLGLLKSLRIHDLGDFFSPWYVRDWIEIVKSCPMITFWFYTRAYAGSKICQELRKLAALPNISGWLSADTQNFSAALLELTACNAWKGIAIMQTDDSLPELAKKLVPWNKLVIFPGHGHGGFLKKGVKPKLGPVCPAIKNKDRPEIEIKLMERQKKLGDIPACLACRKCLPAEIKEAK